jgi:segregation and condensation protein A
MLSAWRSSAPNDLKAASACHLALPGFEGPIELLLALIEREELPITAVSIAAVADQYLAYLESLPALTLDSWMAFVEVAAKLIVIKSRALLPTPPLPPMEEQEDDPAVRLIEQLEEYRRFRQAAQWLGERLASGICCLARTPAEARSERLILSPQSALALLEAYRSVAPKRSVPLPSNQGPSLLGRIKAVLRALLCRPAVQFSELLGASCSRLQALVTFLAVLELVRRRRVHAWQEGPLGPITISRAEPTRIPVPIPATREVQ